jgi:hypothetical protein
MKAWRGGLFGFQPNNSTHEFEYPWAFYVAPLSSGLHVLEIGGAMSEFQFALARAGAVLAEANLPSESSFASRPSSIWTGRSFAGP